MPRPRKSKMDLYVKFKIRDLQNLYKSASEEDRPKLFAHLLCGVLKAPQPTKPGPLKDAHDLGWEAACRAINASEIDRLRYELQANRDEIIRSLMVSGIPFKCNECNAKSEITLDHIIPLAHGGDNGLDNLQFLCRRCNSKKGKR